MLSGEGPATGDQSPGDVLRFSSYAGQMGDSARHPDDATVWYRIEALRRRSDAALASAAETLAAAQRRLDESSRRVRDSRALLERAAKPS